MGKTQSDASNLFYDVPLKSAKKHHNFIAKNDMAIIAYLPGPMTGFGLSSAMQKNRIQRVLILPEFLAFGEV